MLTVETVGRGRFTDPSIPDDERSERLRKTEQLARANGEPPEISAPCRWGRRSG